MVLHAEQGAPSSHGHVAPVRPTFLQITTIHSGQNIKTTIWKRWRWTKNRWILEGNQHLDEGKRTGSVSHFLWLFSWGKASLCKAAKSQKENSKFYWLEEPKHRVERDTAAVKQRGKSWKVESHKGGAPNCVYKFCPNLLIIPEPHMYEADFKQSSKD